MEAIHLCLFMMLCLGVHRSSSEILQRQKRNWIIDSFSIDEGYKGSFPYLLGQIDVEKELTLFKIHGQGVDEDPKEVLKINQHTGEITVQRPVDFEEYQVFKLTFQAYDGHNHKLDTELGIEIQIIDRNDNPPRFESNRYEISIPESTVQGTEVINLKASDRDTNKNNAEFDLKIVSVTPEPHELEFYLNQITGSKTGTISFKGCLDHERAEKYTIIVEAKDHGEEIQLSSSCTVIINIEDGNNHLPLVTGQTGSGRVKEGEENVLVSRLQLTDKDTKGTAAWRAKYQIQGDTNSNFRITTDPETNEGLLYVAKHLDYEDSPLKNVTISVENEIPYYSCKLVSRRTTGLWEIVTISGKTTSGVTGTEIRQSTHTVTVAVEDVNEPPVFDKPNQQVTVGENIDPGQFLTTFTAKDPDVTSANTFVYSIGNDPADWVTVDPVTGKITTSKALDRESRFVKDNIYNVTINVVDNGKPPMTGTATLNIHITDENDNTPTLNVSAIDMCQSDGPSLANIAAFDLDEEPYGGPFSFKLLGNVEGRWRVDPPRGYSINLVKENTVHSGQFKLLLEVSDLQHKTTVHNLSVTVCSCLDPTRPDCHSRKASGSTVGGGTLVIIFFSILLLAGMLLLVFLVSCMKQNKEMPNECSEQHLMQCNIEGPGTDCKVAFGSLNQGYSQNVKQIQTFAQVPTMILKQSVSKKTAAAVSQAHPEHVMSQMEQKRGNYLQSLTDSVNVVSQVQHQRQSTMEQEFNEFATSNTMNGLLGASSTMGTRHQNINSMHRSWVTGSKYSDDEIGAHREYLFKILNTMLYKIQASGVELGDYDPHVYAEEGDPETSFETDTTFIPDISFDPDLDLDLNFKFSTLASICMPSESTTYNTKTSCVTEKKQVESQKN